MGLGGVPRRGPWGAFWRSGASYVLREGAWRPEKRPFCKAGRDIEVSAGERRGP